MHEYRLCQSEDVKLEQMPSVGGDGLIHLTIRDDQPTLVLCPEEVDSLRTALEKFYGSMPKEP